MVSYSCIMINPDAFLIFKIVNKNTSNMAVEISLGVQRKGMDLVNDTISGPYALDREPKILNRYVRERVGSTVLSLIFKRNKWIVGNELKAAQSVMLEMLEDGQLATMLCMSEGLEGEFVARIPIHMLDYESHFGSYQTLLMFGETVLKHLPVPCAELEYDRGLTVLPEPNPVPKNNVNIRLNDRKKDSALYVESQDFTGAQDWGAFLSVALPSLDSQEILANTKWCKQFGRELYWRCLNMWHMNNKHWPLFNLYCFVSVQGGVARMFIREGAHREGVHADLLDVIPLSSVYFDDDVYDNDGYRPVYDHLAKLVITNLDFSHLEDYDCQIIPHGDDVVQTVSVKAGEIPFLQIGK